MLFKALLTSEFGCVCPFHELFPLNAPLGAWTEHHTIWLCQTISAISKYYMIWWKGCNWGNATKIRFRFNETSAVCYAHYAFYKGNNMSLTCHFNRMSLTLCRMVLGHDIIIILDWFPQEVFFDMQIMFVIICQQRPNVLLCHRGQM